MQVAKNWDAWDEQKRHAVSRLSLRNVLRSFPSDARPGRASKGGGSDEEAETRTSPRCRTGAAYYAPEMKGMPLGGVLRIARYKKLRLVFGNWREMAKPLL